MTTQGLCRLVAGAIFFNAFLFGLNIDRAWIAMPAWRMVGVVGWAEFSPSADLSSRALL